MTQFQGSCVVFDKNSARMDIKHKNKIKNIIWFKIITILSTVCVCSIARFSVILSTPCLFFF